MSMRFAESTVAGSGGHIVVTGAAGFIGSHLVDALLARGETVVGIDSLDPWYDVGQRHANLAAAGTNPRFVLHTVDLANARLEHIFDGASVVYHLAARPGVQDSWRGGFAHTSRQNIFCTQVILEAALAAGVERVVCASSSSVYGAAAAPGGDREVRPISPYGVSKAAVEQLAAVYTHRGLTVSCPRYFTVYGPRQRPDMAMHRLFEATTPGGSTFMRRGTGEQLREFTYVGDIVAATIEAGDAPGVAGQTFDVGGGSSISLNAAASMIEQLTGRVVRTNSLPLPAGDPPATVADLEPANRLLGWSPTTTLEQGLEAQYRWHAQRAAVTTAA